MSDWSFILLLIVAIAVFGGLAKGGRKRNFKYNPNDEWPFEKKKLMVAPEQILFSG